MTPPADQAAVSLEREPAVRDGARDGMKSKRRPARSRPTEEQLAAKETAPCWLARFSDTPCAGRRQLSHLIKKERLRFYGVPEIAIWDARVVVAACATHHAELDSPFTDLDIPRSALPQGLEDYAAEHDMTWWLDRTYGLKEDRP